MGKNSKCHINNEGRECTRCHEFKSWQEYNELKVGPRGKSSYCRKCRSKIHFAQQEEDLERNKKHYKDNIPKYKEAHKRYRENNKESVEKYNKSFNQYLKDVVYHHYGGYICSWCGEDDRLSLELDHINNDGYKERHKYKHQYSHIVREGFPKGKFQVLCASCNRAKVRNKGVLPEHRKDKYREFNKKDLNLNG